jgi:hypothetical protein
MKYEELKNKITELQILVDLECDEKLKILDTCIQSDCDCPQGCRRCSLNTAHLIELDQCYKELEFFNLYYETLLNTKLN